MNDNPKTQETTQGAQPGFAAAHGYAACQHDWRLGSCCCHCGIGWHVWAERKIADTVSELAKYKARMEWLHDCSGGTTDAEGCEWGIYRVKWKDGRAVEVWQTCSDFSDLDAEMERERHNDPSSATRHISNNNE